MDKTEQFIQSTLKGIKINEGNYKRILHFLKVFTLGQMIGEAEGLSEHELYVLGLACLLHDIGIRECEKLYHSTAGHLQELEGPTIAGEILEELEVDEDVINRVCFLISKHHTIKDIEGIDWQILLEADFLVNAEEEGYTRNQIESYKTKVFKTNKGKELLKAIYNV